MPRQVFVGNGSDEVLAHVFMALLKHERPLLFPDITYSFYPVYCGLYGIRTKPCRWTSASKSALKTTRGPTAASSSPTRTRPPGGYCLSPSIEQLLTARPDSVVVVDEAYIDFGGESAIPLVARFPNLLVVHTLSKSRSLAGLRVGYAIGHEDLIEALDRVKNSFNSYPLDRLAIAGATAAIEDVEHFERTRRAVMDTREQLGADLSALGFEVLPSAANFIFVRHPARDAGELAAQLRERSIIVRHFKLPRIDQFLRITVGTNAQCEALVGALKDILA